MTQLRNLMITYLKNISGYKHSQLKNKTYKEIHGLYERQQKRNQDFIPMDTEVIKDSGKKDDSSSKPAGGKEQKSAKSDEKAAANYKHGKEELRMWLTVVSDEEETVDPEILSAKYPIVYWESQNLGSVDMEDLHVYKIIRADRNTSYHKSLSSMLRKFDRQDLVDLHRLVMKRFEDTTLEGYNLLLWGDLKVMFEPNAEDAIWSNQHDWTLISLKLYENCGVHTLLMDGTLTSFNMQIEKRFTISGQVGTLWWHAHNSWLGATVYGALIIRQRQGDSYSFPKPNRVSVIMLGGAPNVSDAYTINYQPGDLYKCSSKDAIKVPMKSGETHLLQVINATFIKGDQTPDRYYSATSALNAPFDNTTTTGILKYKTAFNDTKTVTGAFS
ncbi:ribonuclease H-like domain-containing protein, partial [Tanacetum coccineum]